VARTERIIETSALGVLRLPHRFTHYVYVDQDERCIQALEARSKPLRTGVDITIINADVNDCAEQVRSALPPFNKERGSLSFCFVDPFDLRLRFDTIRELGQLKMDFLVLLMLGVDGRRNFQQYLDDSTSTRIGDLIDCPGWRTEYQPHVRPIRFLLSKFDEAMQRIGYLSATDDLHPVRIAGMGVLQYVLAFYSKSELGQRFWRDTRSTLAPQLSFL
jgi:three-Cys-motif partner protein